MTTADAAVEKVTASRKAKQLAPFIVGKWNSTCDVFTALPQQPDANITDIATMVQWVKDTYGKQPGTYEFVRQHPHALTLAEQTTMKAILG